MTTIANTPKPPYVAVIFTNQRTPDDPTGYAQTAEEMVALAAEQDGFLGLESVRDTTGLGITVSYWRDEASVLAWKDVGAHRTAQKAGKSRWYKAYTTRIATVTRDYSATTRT